MSGTNLPWLRLFEAVKPPRPVTITAYLVSSGYGIPKATKHVYHESRAATLPQSRGIPAQAIWEHIFRCTQTGALRRWGYEKRFDHVEKGTPDFPDRLGN